MCMLVCCSVFCSVLQCVCCSVLRCVAVCCSVMSLHRRVSGSKMSVCQCVAALDPLHTELAPNYEPLLLQCAAVCCIVLQCVAVCCSVLQCVAVYVNVLQP